MVNWFAWKRGYLGKSILQKWLSQLSDTVAHKDKTRPRIQNTSQNPKTHPRIQNTSQNPKTHLRIQKDFPESKTGPRIQNTSQIWILETVFEFWDVFWIPGSVFGFWEVFWILGSVLDSGTCFVPTNHRNPKTKHKTKCRIRKISSSIFIYLYIS